MERLTFDGNFCDIAQCRETPGGSFCENGTCSQKEVWLRLKDYEDTGLKPEEVLLKDKADEIALKLMRLADLESLCSYTRLRELAEADKDGRLVVLLCKVGDTVYKVITIQAQKPVMLETQVKTLGQAADISQLIGKKNKVINIFLTSEKAERALQEMEGKV